MRLALIGYGKMGQAIEQLAKELGHKIVACIKSKDWNPGQLPEFDLCLEFTEPQSVLDNMKRLVTLKKPIVIGTTGWKEHFSEIEQLVLKQQIGTIYSSNFSVGVTLFKEIVKQTAQLLEQVEDYDVAGVEIHHNQKIDAPSGTALDLTTIIQNHYKNNFAFSSVRCGKIAGTHTLFFNSGSDTIQLTHESHNRLGFAKGALLAGEWVRDKKGFFAFENCLSDILRRPKR